MIQRRRSRLVDHTQIHGKLSKRPLSTADLTVCKARGIGLAQTARSLGACICSIRYYNADSPAEVSQRAKKHAITLF